MQVERHAKVSMRHLHLYAHLLIADAQRNGKEVRIEWADIPTASIGPDPANEKGLVMRLPQTAALGTEEDAILLKALISHEIVCHGHHTDFSAVPEQGVGFNLWNILEDPRGELLGAKKFPGSKKVIRDGLEVLVDREIFGGPTPDTTHPAEILSGWLVTELRSELLQQNCLSQFAADFRKLAIETFGTKLTGQVKAIALDGAMASDTQGAASAAQRIVELMKLAKDELPPPSEGDQGNGSPSEGDGSESGSQGQQASDASQDGDQKGSGKPQDGGQQEGGGAPQNGQAGGDQPSNGAPGNGSGQGGQSLPEGFEPAPGKLAKAIQDMLSATEDAFGPYGKGLEAVLCEGNEAMQEAANSPNSSYANELKEYDAPKTGGSAEQRSRLRAGARAVAAALTLKIEDLLATFAAVTRRKSSSGTLRTNRVWRVALGDTQVFRTRTRREQLDTCVYLLGDESASMKEVFDKERSPQLHQGAVDPKQPNQMFEVSRKDAAARVLVAAGEALQGADIPFGMATFNSGIREWHSFNDDWSQTLMRYLPDARGGTETHLAVEWALRKLIGRPETRKVLAVVADGAPGNAHVLQAALEEGKRCGIEVRFVLIGEELRHHYTGMSAAHGVARNTRELAKSVFGALEAAIA